MRAELIDGLCQRYHVLPSQLLEEDAYELLQMLNILGLTAESESPESSGGRAQETDGRLLDLAREATTLSNVNA